MLAHAEQLLVLGRDVEAEQRFRDALAGDPMSARALVGLARALSRQGRHGEAEQAVRRALELAPEDVAAHHQLTRIRSPQSNHEVGVGGPVDTQQLLGARDGLLGELHYVGSGG